MIKIKELLKAFVFVALLFAAAGVSVWVSAKLDSYWLLFIVIPIILIVAFILIINSIVSAKCSNCGKEVGVRTGGLGSIWLSEKPAKCQWCGHDAV